MTESPLKSSFRFHSALERPGHFLRREWRPIVLFGTTFAAIMLGALFAVDTSFFYPRIQTDQLLYLLKAQALVETGSTNARTVVNGPFFPYAAMPGVLRAPFLLLFDEFDTQLRAIQCMNVAIVVSTAIMYAYMLCWILPRSLHKWAIGFVFAFILFSPDWLTNTFVPLADAPYAALTTACLIIATMVLSSSGPLASHRMSIIAFAVMFVTACFVRFTAPVLLLLIAALSAARWNVRHIRRRTLVLAAGIPVLSLTVLVVMNADALFGRYVKEVVTVAGRFPVVRITVNLLVSSLPAQIIPVFNLGFQVPPSARSYDPVFAQTPRDIAWSAIGLLISALVIRGLFAVRRRMVPELAYFLAALPVLTLFSDSTTRYLMAYQPILWICFAMGVAAMTRQFHPTLLRLNPRVIGFATGIVGVMLIASFALIRSARTARTAGGGSTSSFVTRTRTYVDDVETTFRELRRFIEQLPRDSTLLVGAGGDNGRFKVISDREYYAPDSNFRSVIRQKKYYVVRSCSQAAECAGMDRKLRLSELFFSRYGDATLRTVFDRRTANAGAVVRLVVPLP